MTSAFQAGQVAALQQSFARLTAADVSAFTSQHVTITQRPEPSYWPFAAMVVSFGAGTVACFEASHLDWAREHVPDDADRAPYFVLALERDAKANGVALHAIPPMLGWALASRPESTTAPAGLRLERVDAAWMNEWQGRRLFTNALGHPQQVHRRFRNQFASVLFDASDQPIAVAGAYDSAGPLEIGVDVTRDAQGRGLATVVVRDVAAAILAAGRTPYYACSVTNTRSQRTALASGFLPALSLAQAIPAGEGMA